MFDSIALTLFFFLNIAKTLSVTLEVSLSITGFNHIPLILTFSIFICAIFKFQALSAGVGPISRCWTEFLSSQEIKYKNGPLQHGLNALATWQQTKLSERRQLMGSRSKYQPQNYAETWLTCLPMTATCKDC